MIFTPMPVVCVPSSIKAPFTVAKVELKGYASSGGVWAATLVTPVSFEQNTTLPPPPEVTPPKAIIEFFGTYSQEKFQF